MHFKNLGEISNANKIIKELLGNTSLTNKQLEKQLGASLKQYSIATIEAAAAQTGLTKAQAKAILIEKELKGKNLEITAAQLEKTAATTGTTVSQTAATASTFSLKTAYEGLAVSLGISTTALTVWIAALSSVAVGALALKTYYDSLERLASETKASAQETKAASAEIESYTEQYGKLRQELLDATTTEERQAEIKRELLAIQTDLNEKYGDEYGKINLVTDAYKDQTEALKNLNKELASDWLRENNKGVNQAISEMEKVREYTTSTPLYEGMNLTNDIKSIVDGYSDKGVSFIENSSGEGYVINIEANAEDAKKVIEELGAEIYGLTDKYEDNNILNAVINNLNNAENLAQDTLDKYQETFNQAQIYTIAKSSTMSADYQEALDAVQQYNDAVASGDYSSIKEARTHLDEVRNSIDLTETKWQHCGGVIEDVFNQADTRIWDFRETLSDTDLEKWTNKLQGLDISELRGMENDGQNGDVFDPLIANAQEAGLTIDELISLLQLLGVVAVETNNYSLEPEKILNKTEMISALNELSSGFESLDKIMKSQKDGSVFDYSLLAENDFIETFGGLGEAYTDFVETISKSPKDIKACQSAYDDLVTEWIHAKGILNEVTEETANVTEAMLTNMGVTNASEVVTAALARQKAEIAWNSKELSEITKEEIEALKTEQQIVKDAEQAWYSYFAQKLLDETYNGNGDIEALKSVIEALDLGTQAWHKYYTAKKDLEAIANSSTTRTSSRGTVYYDYIGEDGIKYSVSQDAYNDKLKDIDDNYDKILNDIKDLTKIDTSYGGGVKSANPSGSSSSKDPKQEEIDWIARRKELLEQLHQVQQEIADDETATYSERLSALDSLIEKDRERAQVAQEAASRYEQAWLEASANLTEEDKKYVINGGNDIKKYDAQELADKGIVDSVEDGEKYIENLKKAIEYRDLMTESQREELANRKEMILHEKTKIDLLKIELDLQQDLNGAITDQINSQMELLEAEGKYVNESYYKDLLQQSKESQSIAEDKLDVLYDELDAAKEAGEEYDGILVEIEQCKNEIIQCQVEQAELNDTIKRLPIERLQMFRDLYAQIVEDMDNYMSLQSSMGLNPSKEELQQYIDLYNEQIDSALKQQGMLKDLLDDYGHGSDKFNETAQEIQDLDNEISSLLVNINELNYQMLQIPVTEMAEEVEKLGVLKEALNNSIAEDNAKGLQTTVEQYRDLHNISLQQLSVLAKQKATLTELLDVYDEESDYYKETVEQINQINGEMSQLVQETYKWSYELLNLPIENLEKVNSNLQLYSSILGDVISEYDSALSGINTLIDREIEGIEKELELLEQVNKARSIELSLEQAKYNLDRAIQQKNILAIKDGEQVWINDIDAERDAKEELASAEYDKMVYSLEQQQEYLSSILEKWQEIKEEIEEAAAIQDANDMFGVDSNWQDKILSGSDDDLRTLFKQLYESASMEKESVDKQVESNERISQMMNEFVTRYQEGSLTYQQALDGINNLLSSMGDGLSAIENLSGMMDLDNIASIGDIASSTQGSITESAELLKQYMAIVESNKQSVEGFETSWDSMSGAVKETVDSFNAAVDSMDAYLEAFVNNSNAISEHTNSWEEMQSLIAEQVEALKKAAEALEKAQKTSSIKGTYEYDDSDDDSGSSEKATGVYHHEYGWLYNYGENGTLVDPETEDDLGVTNYIDFMEKYEDELKKGTYHKGIFKGQIGASSGTKLDDELQKLAHPPISNDERLVVGQVGEYVYQPEQILNTIENAQRMALPPMEELLPHLFVNANPKGLMSNQTKQLVDLLHKEYTNPSIDPINSSNSQVIDFSIGEIHLHEIQDVEQFANKLFANIEPIVTQKIRKIF